MPKTSCDHCGGELIWRWEEAFEKFGFNDGDGQVETWQVEAVLTQAGYDDPRSYLPAEIVALLDRELPGEV